MSRRIYKHSFTLGETASFTMPAGSAIVHVGMQAGLITFWALVNAASPDVTRTFSFVGTGTEFDGEYIGTVRDGDYVWHVFEVEEPS